MPRVPKIIEEHLTIEPGYELHIFSNGGDWEVWLNTEITDYDGLCVGTGRTREDAQRDAAQVFSRAYTRLRERIAGDVWP